MFDPNSTVSTAALSAVVKAVGNLAVDDPVLAKYAAEIRCLGKRVKEDVVAIGRYLDQAQKHAGHGTWLAWIQTEFSWSDQTAYRFIHLYQAQQNPEFHNLWNSNLPVSALSQLAAPNTPQEARDEVAARVEAGERPSCAMVTEAIAKAKGKNADSDVQVQDNQDDEYDPSIAQRRREHEALFTESPGQVGNDRDGDDHANGRDGDGHIDDDAGIPDVAIDDATLEQWKTEGAARLAETADLAASESTDEVNNSESFAVDAELLLEDWDESTPEAQQFLRDLVLEEFFAQAGGADIFDRIPADRLDEVIATFLDKLTVEGMRTRMSEEFGHELRARVPAPKPKSGKPFTKGLNHTNNSARNRRHHRSRH
jgi:hypothetical protein